MKLKLKVLSRIYRFRGASLKADLGPLTRGVLVLGIRDDPVLRDTEMRVVDIAGRELELMWKARD